MTYPYSFGTVSTKGMLTIFLFSDALQLACCENERMLFVYKLELMNLSIVLSLWSLLYFSYGEQAAFEDALL